MPSSAPRPRQLLALAALLALASVGARAAAPGDAAEEPVDEVALLPGFIVDYAVANAELPGLTAAQRSDSKATTLILASVLDTSRHAVGDANRPAEVPVVKAKARPTSSAARPIAVARAAIATPGTQLLAIDDQVVQLHADGLPGPNAPSSDPSVRVLPRAVDPNAVTFGARWGTQDRIDLPILPAISVSARASVFAGSPALHANAVRRSLRLTAQWDDLWDPTIGLTPGIEHLGGSYYEHHATSVQASTIDPAREARWRSFVEVSGEKIAPGNVIENSSAQVRAGASYQTSSSTSVDVSVSRGTMDKPDTQSSVGLSMRF